MHASKYRSRYLKLAGGRRRLPWQFRGSRPSGSVRLPASSRTCSAPDAASRCRNRGLARPYFGPSILLLRVHDNRYTLFWLGIVLKALARARARARHAGALGVVGVACGDRTRGETRRTTGDHGGHALAHMDAETTA